MFIVEYKKNPKCHIWELNSSFLFDLHQNMVTNDQYVTKMTSCARMGDLWGNFPIIVWIVEHLQRSIYIWNKISKHIVFRCGMDHFRSIPLHIAYNFQHFEPIEYVNLVYLGFCLFSKQMIPKFT
jgi:hypothetical protein